MNWSMLAMGVVFGVFSGIVSLGTAIATLDAWPDKLQWLKLVAGFSVSFATTAVAYLITPGAISAALREKGVLK